jgi:hypothetical protein
MNINSNDITNYNINIVRQQINRKLDYNSPLYMNQYSNGEIIYRTITDFDHFPYKRFFRGVYDKSYPIIMEREAGFRPIDNQCYKKLSLPNIVKPDYCFQYPCSTITPCFPAKVEEVTDYKDITNTGCKNRPNFNISP